MQYKDERIEQRLKARIRNIPDYPKPGILFRDITPLLKDPSMFDSCINELSRRMSEYTFDYIAGIEARGFIVGSVLANNLGVGFIPIRKQGKLPSDTAKITYQLEYGMATIEMHKDAIEKGDRVFVTDDLLATGGTARAACDLIESLGGIVPGLAFIIELKDLGGREKLIGRDVLSLVEY